MSGLPFGYIKEGIVRHEAGLAESVMRDLYDRGYSGQCNRRSLHAATGESTGDGNDCDQVDAFDRGLDEAGVEHEVHSYPGAPHSFFDRRYEDHAEASEDAWRRVLGFLGSDRGLLLIIVLLGAAWFAGLLWLA